MFGAAIAVVMFIVWIGYIAETVLLLSSGDPVKMLAWVIATPIVLAFEVIAFRLLDAVAKPA